MYTVYRTAASAKVLHNRAGRIDENGRKEKGRRKERKGRRKG